MREGRRRRRRSLLRKFVIASSFVAALSVLIFAGFMVRHYRQLEEEEQMAEAGRIAQLVRGGCLRALLERDYTAVVEFCLRQVDASAGIESLRIETADGLVLTHNASGWRRHQTGPADGPPEAATRRDETRGVVYREPIVGPDGKLADIEVRFPVEPGIAGNPATYAMTGRVGALALCTGAVFAFFYFRNLTRPMRELHLYAQRVAQGRLDTRVRVPTDDEIGDLAESINQMVNDLDLSQRRLKASMQKEAALREKDLLLREIHHRVKNNMQILTSLLRLQARHVDTPELREVLQESEGRIRSMGLLHEKLYQSESVSTIELHSYIESLTAELLHMNRSPTRPEVRISAAGVRLGLDTALPCGLIITELVSNSMKYAFGPEHREPIVLVSVSRSQDGTFSLVVWDNGCGLPDGLDLNACNSLGLRLVRMLTDQLNGELHYAKSTGARFEITFRESLYINRI